MLHDSVIQRWGTDIVSGHLRPGTRISTDHAANRLGVSRTVIREALRVLESMGLITVRQRIGITVQPRERWNSLDTNIIRWRLTGPDRPEQLKELTEVRSAAEPLAARLAAKRPQIAGTSAFTTAVIGMSTAARSSNHAAYQASHADFHRALFCSADNSLLAGLAEVVAEALAGRSSDGPTGDVGTIRAIMLHGAVAARIDAGDAEAAEQAMRTIVTTPGACSITCTSDDLLVGFDRDRNCS